MSTLKPIKLYSHPVGPNPWKVAIVLEELGLPYTTEFVDFAVIKQEPFVGVNPNGRVPAIEDPNTGVTLWESGAIITYLVAEYDGKDHRISYPAGAPEKYLTEQWLFFQVSGQGPYYGQFMWFHKYHGSQIPSAIARYADEVARVAGVVDLHLRRTGQKYLVGDRCTYADLSFLTWHRLVRAQGAVDVFAGGEKNHAYREWVERLEAREAVRKVYADQERAAAAGH